MVRKRSLLSTLALLILAALLKIYWQGDKSNITDWVKPGDKSGEFKRQASAFRNFISKEPGAEFPPEKDRYHLYVSYACPWGMVWSSLVVESMLTWDEKLTELSSSAN